MSLKELLGEELYNQVIEKAGDNKIAIVSDGNWFPKDKFDAKNQEAKDLQEQLNDRDEQLNALKDVNPDKLKQEIADLQEINNNAKTEYEAQLEQQKKELTITNAIQLALNGQVHDIDLVSDQIDQKKLVIGDDGKVIGLDEQVESLKESKSFLFKTDELPGNGPQILAGGNPNGGGDFSKNPFTKENWNLTEQGKLLNENPDLYNAMKASAGK